MSLLLSHISAKRHSYKEKVREKIEERQETGEEKENEEGEENHVIGWRRKRSVYSGMILILLCLGGWGGGGAESARADFSPP